MRSTICLAKRSPRIGSAKAASSAFAYSVASIVCGAPVRSTRTRSVVTRPRLVPCFPRKALPGWASAGGRQHVLPSVVPNVVRVFEAVFAAIGTHDFATGRYVDGCRARRRVDTRIGLLPVALHGARSRPLQRIIDRPGWRRPPISPERVETGG